MPTAAGLFRAGAITVEHVEVLARVLMNPRTRVLLDGFEEYRLACQAMFETDAHHITWWRNHGFTDLNNLALLCRHHHTAIHTGRYHLTIGPRHTPTFTDPTTNTPVIPRRHRPPPDTHTAQAA